ncbi:hypothetical protein GCM10009734_66750 [Nonomuraea bangladeshensis]
MAVRGSVHSDRALSHVRGRGQMTVTISATIREIDPTPSGWRQYEPTGHITITVSR